MSSLAPTMVMVKLSDPRASPAPPPPKIPERVATKDVAVPAVMRPEGSEAKAEPLKERKLRLTPASNSARPQQRSTPARQGQMSRIPERIGEHREGGGQGWECMRLV